MLNIRRKRNIPELNTTSTADISFMLLTFFLVTSSMDSDKGLARRLPPPEDKEQNIEVDAQKDNVIDVEIDAQDKLTCDGKTVSLKQMKARVMALAKSKPTQHIVSVKADPQASYDAYFKMQDAIVSAYNTVRNQQALKLYGHSYAECSQGERTAIAQQYPQRISEAEPEEVEGLR